MVESKDLNHFCYQIAVVSVCEKKKSKKSSLRKKNSVSIQVNFTFLDFPQEPNRGIDGLQL